MNYLVSFFDGQKIVLSELFSEKKFAEKRIKEYKGGYDANITQTNIHCMDCFQRNTNDNGVSDT